jgi:GT2 family glycosyltransferase
VIVHRDGVRALMATLRSDQRIGVVGSRLLFPGDAGVQHAGIAQMLWGYASNYAVGSAHDDPRVSEQREVFAVTGAMLAIRRDLFERVGGFDEGFRWGYEDVDLSLKAWEAGYSVVYVPDAPSLHLESATLNSRRSTAEDALNYQRYRDKWNHRLAPAEQRYLDRLESDGISRVVIFGSGKAALGLWQTMRSRGIEVVAFTTTRPDECDRSFCGRPVVPLAAVPSLSFDRLMVGSQFYFQVEPTISGFDPTGAPLFPVVC